MDKKKDIFMLASKHKLRFPGIITNCYTVEDLWEFQFDSESGKKENLNFTAKKLATQIIESKAHNFVKNSFSIYPFCEEKLEIVKAIIAEKEIEKEAKKIKDSKEKVIDMLKVILDMKEIDELKNTSTEELKAKIAEIKKA